LLIGSETSPTEGDRLLLHVRAIAGPRLVGSRGEAWFLVLEGVGAGELSYLVREGVFRAYRPAGELMALVEKVVTERPELEVRAREMTVVCETQTLRRLGRNALTVAGYDPRTRSLPHWHTCDGLPEVVSPATLARAREFLEELLRTTDKPT